MNEEQKEALEILKGLEFEEYDWYVKTDKIEGHANDVVEKVEKALQTILNLVEKQQKEIKARLEEIESLYKMMSAKDDEIEELKEDYQILKDDIEGHNIVYVDTPEFEEKYISKDKIEEKMRGEINKNWRNTEQRKCQLYAYDILKELLGE